MSLGAVAAATRQRWRLRRPRRERGRRKSGIVAQCSSRECLPLSSIADEATSVVGEVVAVVWRGGRGKRRKRRCRWWKENIPRGIISYQAGWKSSIRLKASQTELSNLGQHILKSFSSNDVTLSFQSLVW